MFKSVQRHGPSPAHLLFGPLKKFAFVDSQRIVRIDQPLRLDDEKTLMSYNSYKISCVEMKFFGDPLGDHDLPALPDAADHGSVLRCHIFRLSDCQKQRHKILTALAASSTTVPSEISDCTIIITFAHRDSTGTSVGEKAVLVLNARNR